MHARAALAAAALTAAACGAPHPSPVPFGFTAESARAQAALERRLSDAADAGRLRETHRELTRVPHPSGSARDRELAEWIARAFREAGMDRVETVTHDVLVPGRVDVVVEASQPRPWRASMQEAAARTGDVPQAFHAYSASGDVTAPVVYAGDGGDADYRHLASKGVRVGGRIVLVRHAGPATYRGYKTFLAEQQGAAAIVMFADPAGEAGAGARPYPASPWGPDDLIERGSVVYDFIAPGDPLTPGWASVPGAPRLSAADARSLPRIVSVPLSAADGRAILGTLGGPAAPPWWRGAEAGDHRLGPGAYPLRVSVRAERAVQPVRTVTGLFRGRELPEEIVLLGNHRDAWVHGGVDPSSGTASLLELARVIGELRRGGWQPRRSLLFASWDAEELSLTSSVEWVEQHEAWLRDRALAYVNVDSAVSGPRLAAAAVPSLARLVREAADAVVDPAARVPLAALVRDRLARERGLTAAPADTDIVTDRLGGGSDYVPFVHHAGIPAVDLAFEGAYGVYHSAYDTHDWVARFADPSFDYHAALVRLWGTVALRLAQADAVPVDVDAAVARIAAYVAGVRDTAAGGDAVHVMPLASAVAELKDAATAFEKARRGALERGDAAAIAGLNGRAIRFERSFVDPAGLRGRPWYRHLLYAPAPGYASVMLPGVVDAANRGDAGAVQQEVYRLVVAMRRAAALLAGR